MHPEYCIPVCGKKDNIKKGNKGNRRNKEQGKQRETRTREQEKLKKETKGKT